MIPGNLGRQPWFYMNSVVQGLRGSGHDVRILTDKETGDERDIVFKEFRSFPRGIDINVNSVIGKNGFDAIVWSTGLTDFFFRNRIDVLKVPVVAVVTSPRYSLKEIIALGKSLITGREFVKQFFLGPFISKRRIRKFLEIPNLKAVVFECRETLKRYLTDENPPSSPLSDKSGVPSLTKRGEGRFSEQTYNNIFVIPPPLPVDFINSVNAVKAEKGSRLREEFRILYFGPPISLRGIDTLIDAFSAVSKSVSNVKLDILSRIEHEGLLKHERRMRMRIRENGIESAVRVISGMLKPGEIVRHILSSDLVCLPFECVVSDVPIAVLETLAAGVPLITTEVAGVSEFAKNGRCGIIPPGDTDSLARAILKTIHGRERMAREETEINFFDTHNLSHFGSSFDRVLKEVI
jgi:glycosyltransferase involved in cell wall biosynthesis